MFPSIALDVCTVEIFGHCHEDFLIWAAAPGDLFNPNAMDVSTCSPFSWEGYAASRSHVMGFEEEYLTGKSEEVLFRKTLAQYDSSLGYLSIEWKMNQKQEVKAQWETCGRKYKQKAFKRNQCHKQRWNYQWFSQCHWFFAHLTKAREPYFAQEGRVQQWV